ncbi:hypothetical protein RvY_15959-2 [Ramazzottius varieornatus]|uniref:Uncharacterized protein n=1 Tax=Ramazzottius varieornatus TaxID=947166 RepID=A0A1D1W4K8_RAMVA|nr:hypothetical protein RvY_15959-2 [Ramazzottius varieornatus]
MLDRAMGNISWCSRKAFSADSSSSLVLRFVRMQDLTPKLQCFVGDCQAEHGNCRSNHFSRRLRAPCFEEDMGREIEVEVHWHHIHVHLHREINSCCSVFSPVTCVVLRHARLSSSHSDCNTRCEELGYGNEKRITEIFIRSRISHYDSVPNADVIDFFCRTKVRYT